MIVDRDRVIEECWYLCRRAARRFVRPGLDRADLEQVAAIGLIKAVDRYDTAQSAPFEAYAWPLILGELMHYVRDCERLLRAPRGVRDLERRWAAAERELWLLLDREPLDGDVARYVDATQGQLREIRAYRASRHIVSFDLLSAGEQRLQVHGIDGLLDRLTVERMLADLPPLQRQIVRSIHLDGVTMVELAGRLGYSRRHLTRLHRDALERLRSCRYNVSR